MHPLSATMFAARRTLRRCRPPSASIRGPSRPPLPSVAVPSLSGRRVRPARRDAHVLCLVGVQRPHTAQTQGCGGGNGHRWRLDHARWLSASADGPPVEVTVTSSSSTPDDASPSQSDAAGGDTDEPPSPGPNLSKSPDQLAEEKILALQGEIRAHHRHAAYDSALETTVELLELTTDHFGNMHPATAAAHNNVGLMNKMLGNYAKAREAYHESLRIYGEVVGKDHASYAAALSNLGMLERGRVLESEAEDGTGEENDETGGAVSNDEEGVELEKLRDSNTPQSSKMSALERMQLNETAIEYFDEAYRIRLSELGSNHPHTITSRSQLGAAMAAAVIAERKGRIGGLVESELRKMKHQKDVKDAKQMEAYVPEAVARAAKSSSGSKLTRRRWEAAEEHLRGALDTAVENPRGESVGPLISIPVGSGEGTAAPDQKGKRRGLTLPQKDEKKMSTKEKRKLEKAKRRAARDAEQSASDGAGGSVAILGAAGKVTTLSAATAAQNLAVFLKNYADWLRLTLMDEGASKQTETQQSQTKELNQAVQEARHLYEAALHVRSKILPAHQPEVVATKFSLAELLDSPKSVSLSTLAAGEDADTVDGDRANVLREEILSAYNVEERHEPGGEV